MRIMTFNLRYGTAEDGPHVWTARRSQVLDTIRDFDPDILGVQEALDFQVDEVAAALPDWHWIGVGRDDGDSRGEYAAIFFRPILELGASGTFWFSAEPDLPGSKHPECFHPRICTWANFGFFSVYSLHLDNESADARTAAIRLLIDRADERAVLLGDFNATPSDPIFDLLREGGFVDATAECRGPSYHGYGTVSQGERIDFIWARGLTVAEAAILSAAGNASDHYPVVAELIV